MHGADTDDGLMRALDHRRYLGDGVYVAFDGYAIVLSAENGVTSREIVLEPDVWAALAAWVEALEWAALAAWMEAVDTDGDDRDS